MRLLLFWIAVLGMTLISVAAADDGWVRVVPEETDEILATSGMGWETFHRTADSDKNLPPWITAYSDRSSPVCFAISASMPNS